MPKTKSSPLNESGLFRVSYLSAELVQQFKKVIADELRKLKLVDERKKTH